jgi:hypothetical protein
VPARLQNVRLLVSDSLRQSQFYSQMASAIFCGTDKCMRSYDRASFSTFLVLLYVYSAETLSLRQ